MEPKAPEAGSFLEAVAEEERKRKSVVMMAPGAASLTTHINMPAMWEREKVAGDMGGYLELGAGSWSREIGEGRRGRRSSRSTPWVGRWPLNVVMEEPKRRPVEGGAGAEAEAGPRWSRSQSGGRSGTSRDGARAGARRAVRARAELERGGLEQGGGWSEGDEPIVLLPGRPKKK